MRREGVPKERELLCGRIIDRPIRPLFPPGFYHEVQVFFLMVLSNYSSLHNHWSSLVNLVSLDHGKCSFIRWKARSRCDGCQCVLGELMGIFVLNPTVEVNLLWFTDIGNHFVLS